MIVPIRGVLNGVLDPQDEIKFRNLLAELDRRTLGVCPICHGGSNAWGHTDTCPVARMVEALYDAH
jgi:hypothetical protein